MAPAGEAALLEALRPWERQLASEALRRWLLRGATAGLAAASLVLLIGWLTPLAEAELQPYALEVALAAVVAAGAIGLRPAKRARTTAALDTRLRFGDRLATAWIYRADGAPIARLQRADALAGLQTRSPRTDLRWRPARFELGGLGLAALLAVVLLITPSPQQTVLDRQVAEQQAVQQAADRLDALREDAAATSGLTPEQAQRLDELLKQAQADLAKVRTQKEASAIVARAEDQLNAQLADPNADLRDEALAAMSETLAAEPLTRQLGDALQHEDAQATSDALNQLAAKADQLSDVERQALSRALQRASNVGRGDPRSASALRDASRAIASGDPSQAAAA